MPSEPRDDQALVAAPEKASGPEPAPEAGGHANGAGRILTGLADAYRGALAEALEEARAGLRALRSTANGRGARAAGELGALALGPLDPDRFAALLDPAESPDPARLGHYEEAVAVLTEASAEATLVAPVPLGPADALRDAVDGALRRRGRGFGAVRALALLRSGAFREDEHRLLLEGLPFRSWRSLERNLAPPILLSVPGAALDAAPSLAEFLDGKQRIVLVVEDPSPPAPLAPLIAPGRLVLQAAEANALEALAAFPGPAVAALVPDGAARFIWHPEEGKGEAGRLEVHHRPASPPRGWIGGMSPRQQAAQLGLLDAWAARAAPGAASDPGDGAGTAATAGGSGPSPPRPPEPAERLAAWLLDQAGSGERAQG